jgi:PAS domain S-box-containing protein
MYQSSSGEDSRAFPSPPAPPDVPSLFVVQEALALCLASVLTAAGDEADGGAVYLINPAGSHYSLLTWQDLSQDAPLDVLERYDLDAERSQLLRLGMPFAVNCRRPDTTYPVLISAGENTVTVFPLMVRDRPLGSLDLISRRGKGVTLEAMGKLVPLTQRLAGLAMHLCQSQGAQPSQLQCPAFSETVGDLFFILGMDGQILWVNQAVSTTLMRPAEGLLGMPFAELHPPQRQREVRRALAEMLGGSRNTCHVPFQQSNGDLVCADVTATRGRWRDRPVLIAVARALNPCRKARMELQRSRDQLERAVDERQKRLLEHLRLQSTMATVSRDLISTTALGQSTRRALRLFGERLEADRACLYQLSGGEESFACTHEWCAPSMPNGEAKLRVLSGSAFPWWMARLHREGHISLPDVSAIPGEARTEQCMLSEYGVVSLVAVGISAGDRLRGIVSFEFRRSPTSVRPATLSVLRLLADSLGHALERHHAEQRVWQSERSLRDLLADTDALICRFSPDGKLHFANHAFASFFGSNPTSLCGTNLFALVPEEKQEEVRNSFGSLTPVAPTCVQERYVPRCDGQPRLLRWTERALFDPEGRPIHYQSVGIDITDLVQARHEAMESLKHVERTLRNAVRALAKIQEIRDPYTAGHQVRVADLSVQIARRLDLSETEQSEVYYGALLHDLGKVRIPMDILAKPGRLTEAEYSLIQCHPDSGFDILREIHLAEAVGKITLGHHERLDGSGYPAGLQGDEIILGARIVAVADVVDSMVSHRPYRPALPAEEALAEVSQHSGTKFDRRVVDACLALFRQHRYRFPEASGSARGDVTDDLPRPPLPQNSAQTEDSDTAARRTLGQRANRSPAETA